MTPDGYANVQWIRKSARTFRPTNTQICCIFGGCFTGQLCFLKRVYDYFSVFSAIDSLDTACIPFGLVAPLSRDEHCGMALQDYSKSSTRTSRRQVMCH